MFLIQVNDLSEGTEFVRGCSALLHLCCDQNFSFFLKMRSLGTIDC